MHVDDLRRAALPGYSLGGGHTIEDEGVALTQRTVLNFVGAGVTAADSGGKTVVTIAGGGGGGGSLDDVLAVQALL